ncbi:MAG: TlpA family protein disulfide reductase [Bacteroides sp.]|nr:TlpA family protein disulfide reductase [Bacteroides sp.]
MPKLAYVDMGGEFVDYTPKKGMDTLALAVDGPYKEIGLSYRDFENIYFLLYPGDTVIVRTDTLDYPILTSKHHPERDRVYNMNSELRKGRTHSGLEAKTCLGNDVWVRIARTIDYIKEMNWDNLASVYCPLDSLSGMFNAYKAAYADTIAVYKEECLISDEMYRQFQYLLRLKGYEAQRILNEDTTYYHELSNEMSDACLFNPSYHEFLNYYLWHHEKHIPKVLRKQGSGRNWNVIFDELIAKEMQHESKKQLLKRCIEEIGKNFSAKELKPRLERYVDMTGDMELLQAMNEKYALSADANTLFLKGYDGRQVTFDALLEKHKGKVIYVDFWASWCQPCREEMEPARRLRERYAGKDVVFLYLAYKDTEEEWKRVLTAEGTVQQENHYLILNSQNCKMLERLELTLIPRFILFDKQGRLAASNAPRPSMKTIDKLLEQYLNE